jgi:hypothetical protein
MQGDFPAPSVLQRSPHHVVAAQAYQRQFSALMKSYYHNAMKEAKKEAVAGQPNRLWKADP